MGLFKPDLYRSFAIGFALGALALAFHYGPENWGEAIPQAQAHTTEAPATQ